MELVQIVRSGGERAFESSRAHSTFGERSVRTSEPSRVRSMEKGLPPVSIIRECRWTRSTSMACNRNRTIRLVCIATIRLAVSWGVVLRTTGVVGRQPHRSQNQKSFNQTRLLINTFWSSIYIRQSPKTPALCHFLVFWLGRSGGTNYPATQHNTNTSTRVEEPDSIHKM